MKKKTNDKNVSSRLKQNFDSISNEIALSAILNRIYAEKLSSEIVTTKVDHQINAMESSIQQINHKFTEKSKNYDKVNGKIISIMEEYENVLKQFCITYDDKIEEKIIKKVELESKLLMAVMQKEYLQKSDSEEEEEKGIIKSIGQVAQKIRNKVAKKEIIDVKLINKMKDGQDIKQELKKDISQTKEYQENQRYIIRLEKEVKNLNKEIRRLNEEKKNKVFEAMEIGTKQLSTQIRKPRKITKITKFFANKFNPYKAIIKNVIEPMKQRIDEFKVNDLNQVNVCAEELEISQIEKKIKSAKNEVLSKFDNKVICKKLGILEE